MNLDELLRTLTADQYQVLKRCVELGKWPDGRFLSLEEKEISLQVLIAWDLNHHREEERIGYIPQPPASTCGDEDEHVDHEQRIIFRQRD